MSLAALPRMAPVAVTGIGIITAQGVGLEATWRGICEGQDRLAPWRHAPREDAGGKPHPLALVKVAECPEPPRPDDLPPRLWEGLSQTQQFAAVCADEAMAQAGFPRRAPASLGPVGLFMATTVCGMDKSEQFYTQYRVDKEAADTNLMRRLQPYGLLPLLARRHRLTGPRQVCLTTCVGSAMAIGAACDAIGLGQCRVALAGGSEALCRVVLSGFHALKVVAPDGCRPFDKGRPGITVGEGCAVLVLESADHALRRGAQVLGQVRGFAATCDAHHITAPDPEGRQAARAIREALERAGVAPGEVGYINAHGTGTRDNDAMECRAIHGAFAPATDDSAASLPPVSSTKRLTGHTFGAAGAIEAALCLQALRTGHIPVNAGSLEPDPAIDLPVVRAPLRPESGEPRVAVSCNFAFGGNNTALVLARAPGEDRER